MVVSLGPGKFYGSSLPRPRIYTDVKLSDQRVDPPVPVMDPFLSWAEEAHWSMGGLSFKRLRLQGRIEGSVAKLRKLREKQEKLKTRNGFSPKEKESRGNGAGPVSPPSPPQAPEAVKRKRMFVDLFEEEEEEGGGGGRKGTARKLVAEFEKVAEEGQRRTRRNGGGGVGEAVMKVVEEVNRMEMMEEKGTGGKKSGSGKTESGIRTSPRLAKQRSKLD